MMVVGSTGCRESKSNNEEQNTNVSYVDSRAQARRGQQTQRLASNNDGLLSSPSSRLSRLVDMVQTEHVFRRKLVVIYCIICEGGSAVGV